MGGVKGGRSYAAGFGPGVFELAYGDLHHTFSRLVSTRKMQLMRTIQFLQLRPGSDPYWSSYDAICIGGGCGGVAKTRTWPKRARTRYWCAQLTDITR